LLAESSRQSREDASIEHPQAEIAVGTGHPLRGEVVKRQSAFGMDIRRVDPVRVSVDQLFTSGLDSGKGGERMTLHDVLRTKGSEVFTTSPDTKLSEIVRLLIAHNCGSLIVLEDEDPQCIVGIVTERDILRSCAEGRSLDETPVAHIMTREVITGHVNESVADTMGVMTDRRIRHLPLVDDQGLMIGLISIGDVVKAQHDRLTAENHHLKNYIQS